MLGIPISESINIWILGEAVGAHARPRFPTYQISCMGRTAGVPDIGDTNSGALTELN